MSDNVRMADDEIERLLREVAGATGSTPDARAGSSAGSGDVSRADSASTPASALAFARGRFGFAVIAGAALGVVGWAIGLFLPFLGAGSMGAGAAFGAFTAVLVTGAPGWLSR